MKKKTKVVLASLLLGASFATVATGCNGLKGDYSLTNFTVDVSKVALTYEIGDTVDLSGLIMKATFSDDETKTVAYSDVKIYLNNEDITNNLSKITESAGNKEIKVVYTSEYGTKSKNFTITVKAEEIQLDSIDTFNTPAFLVAFKDQLAKANDADTTANESVFFKNTVEEGQDEPYKVGDDNAFKLLPVADAMDFDTGDIITLASVTVDTTVYVYAEGAKTQLNKSVKDGENFVYEYYQGETLFVTEYAKKNEFQFAPASVGMKFYLSVLPDFENVYEENDDIDPITITVEVVDAYNVYNTQQLAVLDNSKRVAWADYKGTAGLTGITTNGVVLHDTMRLTVADIPEDFYYTLPDNYNVKYVEKIGENSVSKTPEEWGLTRTFLKQHYENYATNPDDEPKGDHASEDYVFIYQRVIAEGQSFAFYGNYFEVDASQIPLVCAFKANRDNKGNTYVNNDERCDTYYDTDFSNAVLFHIIGEVQVWACENNHTISDEEPPYTKCEQCDSTTYHKASETDETFYFDNLALKGNTQTKQLSVDYEGADKTEGAVEDKECLVFAGGIILCRVNDTKAKLDNVRNYNFFISFLASQGADIEYSRTKCFDSYQNAIYSWGYTNITVNKSFFKRAGGPLVIIQHKDAEEGALALPTMTVSEDSIMYSALTGSELWFISVGAATVMPQFVALDGLFMMAGKTIYAGRTSQDTQGIGDGKMNVISLLMQEGSNAEEALASVSAQGLFTYGDACLDRMANSELGQTIRGVLATGAPVFNIGNQVFYLDASLNVYNVTKPTDAEYGALSFKSAVQQANYVGINMGGLSMLFELAPLIIIENE